jgi:dipeptidyl aminopeptidase/acylaminoacyl peptidase
VEYESGDLVLKAWISPDPQDGQRHPAVVYVHGGFALGQGDWSDASAYLQSGYVVMTPALRGENGNPGHFELFYGEVEDVIAAGRYVQRLPYVDPARVFVAGHSTGGTLAMLSAMLPSPFAAAASFGGSPDQESFFQAWDNIVPFNRSDPRETRLRSPSEFAGSFRCPLYLFVGAEDSGYLGQTRKLASDAKRTGKPCEAHVVPGDHFQSLEPSIQRSINEFAKIRAGGR